MHARKQYSFFCVCVPNYKRKWIAAALAPLGKIRWSILPPLKLKDYPETSMRVAEALESMKRIPKSALFFKITRTLLALYYNGTRNLFEKNPSLVAVCWNGLVGIRRAFMDAALDAGVKRLFFERAPFNNRFTVDPCGVNFKNGLPANILPYKNWFIESKKIPIEWAREQEQAHRRKKRILRTRRIINRQTALPPPLTEPFLFVPLQVSKDSQLRMFGGSFRTIESFVDGLREASKKLPEGWYLRIKEHPSSKVFLFKEFEKIFDDAPMFVDNKTDTFELVKNSRGIVTVNSSIGLQAMFFKKPVVAAGQCFWAIEGVSASAPTVEALGRYFSAPDKIEFDPEAREMFLSFLCNEYYPVLIKNKNRTFRLAQEDIAGISARLQGKDKFGFWDSTSTC